MKCHKNQTLPLRLMDSALVLTNASIHSKESIIANLYRSTVYRPFISKIHKTIYQFDESSEEIPEYLRAVSWQDGANVHIKLITSEENLKLECELKITTCKHSVVLL